MVDECSFFTERRSTAIVRDNMIWHILIAKRWTCALSECFFDKSAPSQICLVKLLLLDEKVARSLCGSSILEKSL